MEIRISGGLDDQLFPFGCTLKDGRAIFCTASDCEKLYLRLYRSGRFYKKIEFPAEYRMGDVWRMAMEGIPADGSFSYTYEIDGHEAADIYGQFTEGRETFGKRAHGGRPVRTVIRESSGTVGKSLQGSRAHFIPYEDCIIYRLHVRGFTRDKSSGLSEELRGTFAGAAEMIPYIRELGANVIELMPAYEYNELERQRAGAQRINYWGFTQDAMRFAPKEAFGGEKGFRKLLEDLHGAGMELVLGMYFAGNEPEDQVLSVIRNWRLRYGIDGVHIVGYAPMKLLLNDPYLKGMKLWADSIDPSDLRRESSEGPYAKKEEKALSDSCAAAYNDSFQNDIRRFIKGDEGMVRRAMELYKDIPGAYARINYTANVSGFSLWDVLDHSIDALHGRRSPCERAGTGKHLAGSGTQLQRRQQRLNLRERTAIVCGRHDNQPLVSIDVTQDERFVGIRYIMHLDILYSVDSQLPRNHIHHFFSIAVHRSVCYHHAILAFAPAQLIVYAYHFLQLIVPNRAVGGAYIIYRDIGKLCQRLLHEQSVFRNNIGIIAGHLRIITGSIHFRIDNTAVQRTETAESIAGKKHFILNKICHHRFRPMNHRREMELQCLSAQIYAIAVGHNNHILFQPIITFQHIGSLGVAHDLDFREFTAQCHNTSGVVRLHMVDYQIIYLYILFYFLNPVNLLETVRHLNSVNHRVFLRTAHQIRIIAHAVRKRPNALEACSRPVVNTNIMNAFYYLRRNHKTP